MFPLFVSKQETSERLCTLHLVDCSDIYYLQVYQIGEIATFSIPLNQNCNIMTCQTQFDVLLTRDPMHEISNQYMKCKFQ